MSGSDSHPIAVGETLHRLVSKVCCFAIRPTLPDTFLPFGQVGVGVSGDLEAVVHSLRTILSTVGSNPDLCCICLMLLMNVVILPSCLGVSLFFLSFLLGFNGAIVVLGSCALDLIAFCPPLAFSRVTRWILFFFH